MITKNYINQLSYTIVGCAIEVHEQLGPGLLESVYQLCFQKEMENAGLVVQSQIKVPVQYKGQDLGSSLRLDFLINNLIIIELKTVEQIMPVHKSQLLSYLKLTNKPKGLLINFYTENITKQLVPMVTNQFSMLQEK